MRATKKLMNIDSYSKSNFFPMARSRSIIPSLALVVLELLFLFLLVPTIISCSFEKQPHQSLGKHDGSSAANLFIFGDSFFDPGNNNYIDTTSLDRANFWPYGITFFNYPTGRFSDGRLISDFIAEYAKLPLIPPYRQPRKKKYFNQGVNFASAGAGALSETFKGSVIDLRTQVRYFGKIKKVLKYKLGKVEVDMMLSKAVYMFSIGSNDYLSLFLTNSSIILDVFSKAQYVEMVVANITTAIHEIYKRGGRKFVFMNVGNLGCAPGLRVLQQGRSYGGCLEEASTLAKSHNQAFSKELLQLGNQLNGFKYSLYDFNRSLSQFVSHHSRYGFKEGETACCGTGKFRGIFSCGGKRPPVKEFELCKNPKDYVFWDSYHLTQKAYNTMAHQMWTGLPPIVKPFNLSHLFNCMPL